MAIATLVPTSCTPIDPISARKEMAGAKNCRSLRATIRRPGSVCWAVLENTVAEGKYISSNLSFNLLENTFQNRETSARTSSGEIGSITTKNIISRRSRSKNQSMLYSLHSCAKA